MRMKPLILALSFLAVFSSALVSQEKPRAKPTGADERISIAVDKVERAAQFPERLSPGQTFLPPDPGCDYVIVHVSIVGKKDLKVALTELRLSEPNSPHLVDDLGEKYWALFAQYNATRGFQPLGEGGSIVFQVPTQTTPVQLRFIYPYRDETDPSRSIRYGQVDVKMSRSR